MVEPAGQDTKEKQDAWISLGVRTDIPHPARVYDYMLGGKDNFAADREMAVRGLQLVPEMRVFELARGRYRNRARCVIREMAARRYCGGEVAGGS